MQAGLLWIQNSHLLLSQQTAWPQRSHSRTDQILLLFAFLRAAVRRRVGSRCLWLCPAVWPDTLTASATLRAMGSMKDHSASVPAELRGQWRDEQLSGGVPQVRGTIAGNFLPSGAAVAERKANIRWPVYRRLGFDAAACHSRKVGLAVLCPDLFAHDVPIANWPLSERSALRSSSGVASGMDLWISAMIRGASLCQSRITLPPRSRLGIGRGWRAPCQQRPRCIRVVVCRHHVQML